MRKSNIVLIGMPGVGKSTVGVLLAKAMRLRFIDTDVVIQVNESAGLQEIIDSRGLEEFCRLEEKYVIGLDVENSVIATGGSVVYSSAAMESLANQAVIIHLDLDLEAIKKRINNLSTRGVVMAEKQSLDELYEKRHELYKKYAEITIDCCGKNQDKIVTDVITRIGFR